MAHTKQCKLCKKDFITPDRRTVYCSQKCTFKGRGLTRRTRIIRKCQTCGKEFETHPCRVNRKNRGRVACFCSTGCSYKFDRRDTEARHKNAQGYVMATLPKDHPVSIERTKRGIRNHKHPEHRLVMEKHLGRYLLPYENVHHKNGIRDDNRIENLELWTKAQPSGARVKDLREQIKGLVAENHKLKLELEEHKEK